MRTFSNLFQVDYHHHKLEFFKIGYRTIYLFTIIPQDSNSFEEVFYSKDIRLIFQLATLLENVTFYWSDEPIILEEANLEFILDDFKEDIIILIDQ